MIAEAVQVRLSVLLNQVKMEEATDHSAKKETLLTLAECILTRHDYSVEEHREAVAVLAKYHLALLVDQSHPNRSQELIEREREKPYVRRCARSGRIMTKKESIEAGYGRVCRKAIVDNNWTSDDFTENKPAHKECYDSQKAQLQKQEEIERDYGQYGEAF